MLSSYVFSVGVNELTGVRGRIEIVDVDVTERTESEEGETRLVSDGV